MSDDLTKAAPAVASSFLFCPLLAFGHCISTALLGKMKLAWRFGAKVSNDPSRAENKLSASKQVHEVVPFTLGARHTSVNLLFNALSARIEEEVQYFKALRMEIIAWLGGIAECINLSAKVISLNLQNFRRLRELRHMRRQVADLTAQANALDLKLASLKIGFLGSEFESLLQDARDGILTDKVSNGFREGHAGGLCGWQNYLMVDKRAKLVSSIIANCFVSYERAFARALVGFLRHLRHIQQKCGI